MRSRNTFSAIIILIVRRYFESFLFNEFVWTLYKLVARKGLWQLCDNNTQFSVSHLIMECKTNTSTDAVKAQWLRYEYMWLCSWSFLYCNIFIIYWLSKQLNSFSCDLQERKSYQSFIHSYYTLIKCRNWVSICCEIEPFYVRHSICFWLAKVCVNYLRHWRWKLPSLLKKPVINSIYLISCPMPFDPESFL